MLPKPNESAKVNTDPNQQLSRVRCERDAENAVNNDGEVPHFGVDRWGEALSWHDTLRGAEEKDLSDALVREWRHWYADAENQRTFDNLSRILADRRLYRDRSLPSRGALDADQYDLSVPIAEWRKAQARAVARKMGDSGGSWWRSLSAGFAAAISATVGVLMILRRLRSSCNKRRGHRAGSAQSTPTRARD